MQIRHWLSRLLCWTTSPTHRHQKVPGRGRFRLTWEQLESRTLLSVGDLLHTIKNPMPGSAGGFGTSVAGVGNNVLIGAPTDDAGANDAGAAYLFDGSTGALLRTFNNPAPGLGDNFGWSVAAVGNKVLIGAPYDDAGVPDAGTAYLFDSSSGALLRTINNPAPGVGDEFGWSVAAMGNNILIGAIGDSTITAAAGSVYLFDGASGALLRPFNNPFAEAFDGFGSAITAVGNNILVGAFGDEAGANNAGSAYLLDASTGDLVKEFNKPNPLGQENFGAGVAVVGNNLLITSPADDTGAPNAGTAYLYDGSSFALLRAIHNPTPAENDFFGWSVAAVGSSILLGAYGDDTGAADAGSAYLVDGSSGMLLRTFNNPTPASGDNFGMAVGAVGNNFAVRAPSDDTSFLNAGAAYLLQGADLVYGNDSAGTHDLSLRRNGNVLELVDNVSSTVLRAAPLGETQSALVVGAAGRVNSLTIDEATGGAFALAQGVEFAGGAGGSDVLRVLGAAQATLTTGMLFGPSLPTVTFNGLEGASLTGGPEDNFFDAMGFGAAVTLTGNAGDDYLRGGSGKDRLLGGSDDDSLAGGSGNDVLDGGAGEDRLSGGGGDDQLTGGADDDVLDGGSGTDKLIESGNVNFTLSNTALSGPGDDSLRGIEKAQLTGGASANAFTVSGWTGNAALLGGGGIDKLLSSNDADFTLTSTAMTRSTDGFFSLTSIETAQLTGGFGDNRINASAFALGGVTLDGGAGDDSLFGGTGADLLVGNAGDDSLRGGNGSDKLTGGTGTDRLFGDAGVDTLDGGQDDLADILTGGLGADVFRAEWFLLLGVKKNRDLPVDFSAAEGDNVI